MDTRESKRSVPMGIFVSIRPSAAFGEHTEGKKARYVTMFIHKIFFKKTANSIQET